jgi:CTP:molybdopterin cytidylyltransferase MocA
MDATNIPAHPVYFPKRCYAELISLAGDNGAKNIIKNPILLNKINDRNLTEDIFIDVDTQERFDRVYKQKQRTA